MVLLLLTLLDGSLVSLQAKDLVFKIDGKYGSLSVPAGDVAEISLGVHLDPVIEGECEGAYKNIGENAHGFRVMGMKYLSANKRNAYKYVVSGLKSSDPEVVKRCEQLKAGYGGIYPKIVDIVRIDKYGELTCNVTNTFIEGKSESLGVLRIPISQIVKVARRGLNLRTVLEPNHVWEDFGYIGSRLSVRVSGQVDWWPLTPGQYQAGPNGLANGAATIEGYPAGAVVGRVNGKEFYVGESFQSDGMEPGILFLRINKTAWKNSNPSGNFTVEVE